MMYCSSSLHPNANNENISTSDIQEAFVRITRSQAKKALGGVLIPPIKPSFKQQKRRAVFKDVSNTPADNYLELINGGNIKADRKCLKEPNKTAKEGASVAMEIPVDLHTEKLKLVEDLSNFRMTEAQDANFPNSKDEETTDQQPYSAALHQI